MELLCEREGAVLADSGDLFACEFKPDDGCSGDVRLSFCPDVQDDADKKSIKSKDTANFFLDFTTTSKASVHFIFPLPRGRRLTPELTRRETSASCGKFSMRAALFPVGFNEQIDRSRCIVFKLGFIGCRIQPTITPSRSVFIAACLSPELTRRETPNQAFKSCG